MTITYPISNPVGNPVVAPSSSGPTLLDSISGLNIEAEYDATLEDSYGGSGKTWANLIASPNSGAGQTDLDMYLGLDGAADDGDEPTFNGTAGDSAAYFSFDGGDFFAPVTSANHSVINSAHKSTTSGFWLAAAFRTPSSLTNFNGILGTGAWNVADDGFAMYTISGNSNLWFQSGADTGLDPFTPTMSTSTDYLLIVSWDFTGTTNNIRGWINSTTKGTDSVTRAASTTTANEGGPFLGAIPNEGAANGIWETGARWYHASWGEAFIDDAQAAEIFTLLEARHGRDYTP